MQTQAMTGHTLKCQMQTLTIFLTRPRATAGAGSDQHLKVLERSGMERPMPDKPVQVVPATIDVLSMFMASLHDEKRRLATVRVNQAC